MKKLNLRLSHSARDAILHYHTHAQSELSEPVAVLMRTIDTANAKGTWEVGFLEKQQTQFAASEAQRYGETIYHDIDGIEITIDQFQYLDELDGKVLDFKRGRFLLLDREDET